MYVVFRHFTLNLKTIFDVVIPVWLELIVIDGGNEYRLNNNTHNTSQMPLLNKV